MTVGLIVLVSSVLVIFTCGVFVGYRISARRLTARARRQDAAQLSLYRQLHELQAARQEDDAARSKVRALQPT